MITFRYTTGYHLLMQMISWFFNLLLIVFGGFIGGSGGFVFMLFAVIILNIVRASSKGNLLEDDIAAFLYLKYSLKVDINFSESREFSFLFIENYFGNWYPLTEIKSLPKDKRKEYLYNFVEMLREKRQNYFKSL